MSVGVLVDSKNYIIDSNIYIYLKKINDANICLGEGSWYEMGR